MPRKTDKQKPESPQWYEDDDLWLDLLEALDETQAERAARLFHRLAKELKDNGAEGAYRVRCCLQHAQSLAFPFTKLAHDCKVAFIDSLDQPETATFDRITGRKPR